MTEFIFQVTVTDFRQILADEISKYFRLVEKEKPKKEIKYLTRKETAEMIRVSTVTLNKYKRYKLLLPKKIGGRVIYLEEDVIAAINDGRLNRFK